MKKRDWYKAITWEITSLILTWIIAVIYFKSLEVTLFAILLTLFKIPFYVMHTNLWRKYR